MNRTVTRLLVQGMLFAAVAAPAFAQQEATGAGASFPAPLYSRWAADYHKATGVKINYQSVGSGAGLRQISHMAAVQHVEHTVGEHHGAGQGGHARAGLVAGDDFFKEVGGGHAGVDCGSSPQ